MALKFEVNYWKPRAPITQDDRLIKLLMLIVDLDRMIRLFLGCVVPCRAHGHRTPIAES